jgi:hypothetical protein
MLRMARLRTLGRGEKEYGSTRERVNAFSILLQEKLRAMSARAHVPQEAQERSDDFSIG